MMCFVNSRRSCPVMPAEPDRRWRPGVLAAVLAAILLLTVPSRAQAQVRERWYAMEMFGGKAGWMMTSEKTEGDRITTSSRMQFNLRRDQANVEMSMEGEFVETKDGKPVSMRSVQKLAAIQVVQDYTFKGDTVEVKTTQGGTTTTDSKPTPAGEWLTPAAAERYSVQRYKSGAKEIIVRLISPENGLTVVTTSRTGFEPVKIDAMGRTLDAVKSTTENSVAPGLKSVEFLDAEGELIRSETMLGGSKVVLTLATKEEAQGPGKAPAPEVMASTMVKPEGEIKNPRSTTNGVYVLSVPEAPMPTIPATGSQAVEKLGETSVKLTIAAKEFAPAPEADVSNAAFLKATAMCNADDAEVKRLAAEAVKGKGDDKAERARAMRTFVHRYISGKNLDVGFASASEVARNRQGDCSEHGVLLAALLRADGIPSRVCAGLIYADSFAGQKAVFGYHMWAQALVEVEGSKRWVDLDATLPSGRAYDATHITLGVSDLADGDPTSGLTAIATLMGRLKIKVESVQ